MATYDVMIVSPISGKEIKAGKVMETAKGKFLPKMRTKAGNYVNIPGGAAVETAEECERIVRAAYLKRVESETREKIEGRSQSSPETRKLEDPGMEYLQQNGWL